jgi:hypothetical protein
VTGESGAQVRDAPRVTAHHRQVFARVAHLLGRAHEGRYGVATLQGLIDHRAADAAGRTQDEESLRRHSSDRGHAGTFWG